jgi:hypothetical protein
VVTVGALDLLTELVSGFFHVLSVLCDVFLIDVTLSLSVIGIVLVLYVGHCKVRPYIPCWWCAGKKRVYGWFGAYSHYSCWWCKGMERRRYAARFFGWD